MRALLPTGSLPAGWEQLNGFLCEAVSGRLQASPSSKGFELGVLDVECRKEDAMGCCVFNLLLPVLFLVLKWRRRSASEACCEDGRVTFGEGL